MQRPYVRLVLPLSTGPVLPSGQTTGTKQEDSDSNQASGEGDSMKIRVYRTACYVDLDIEGEPEEVQGHLTIALTIAKETRQASWKTAGDIGLLAIPIADVADGATPESISTHVSKSDT